MSEIVCIPGFRIEHGKNGRLLVADVAWEAGATLFRFLGEVVRTSDATVYALQIDEDLFLQSSPDASYFDDYVNHSCAPTARVEYRDDGVYLVALRRILPGEEVTFDYNTTEYDMALQASVMDAPCTFDCDCGAAHCVGWIKGFRYLSQAQREFRVEWLSPYLRRVYEESKND